VASAHLLALQLLLVVGVELGEAHPLLLHLLLGHLFAGLLLGLVLLLGRRLGRQLGLARLGLLRDEEGRGEIKQKIKTSANGVDHVATRFRVEVVYVPRAGRLAAAG
jgi:hypothetical protein